MEQCRAAGRACWHVAERCPPWCKAPQPTILFPFSYGKKEEGRHGVRTSGRGRGRPWPFFAVTRSGEIGGSHVLEVKYPATSAGQSNSKAPKAHARAERGRSPRPREKGSRGRERSGTRRPERRLLRARRARARPPAPPHDLLLGFAGERRG